MPKYPRALAIYLNALDGPAFDYATDYADWWIEGGRRPTDASYALLPDEMSGIRTRVQALCRSLELASRAASL